MGYNDLFVRDIITTYGVLLTVVTVLTVFLARKWTSIRRRLFHDYLTGFEVDCAYLAQPYKELLLEPLNRMISKDEILRVNGVIRILEINVKTGENITFYPKGAHVICVDWNLKLRDYLLKGNRSEYFSHIDIEQILIGDGGSMTEVPTGSVDAVITTRSLCSVDSVPATLCEIHRVLAPGGKYFFMEHLPDHESTIIRYCQKILTRTRIWSTLFGNCRLDFNPIPDIKNAGFEHVLCTSVTLEGYTTHPIHLTLSRVHVFGVATR